ncbi:hypothetical protein F5Y03DRAFT_242048 [Xylaria venustula]|nr:hypothetical protein F5Y03DRAFT_242048 [Xylaria venustula]
MCASIEGSGWLLTKRNDWSNMARRETWAGTAILSIGRVKEQRTRGEHQVRRMRAGLGCELTTGSCTTQAQHTLSMAAKASGPEERRAGRAGHWTTLCIIDRRRSVPDDRQAWRAMGQDEGLCRPSLGLGQSRQVVGSNPGRRSWRASAGCIEPFQETPGQHQEHQESRRMWRWAAAEFYQCWARPWPTRVQRSAERRQHARI